jgi:uncharacterized protein
VGRFGRTKAGTTLLVLSATLASLTLVPTTAEAVSPDVVISQVYGGGGNSGATYANDFVELYNRGTTPVPLEGWSVQYASATGTGNLGVNTAQLTELTGTIGPGQHLLIQEASGGAAGAPLPTAAIVDPTPINMAAGAGKVALVTDSSTLGCNGSSTPCGADQLARIRDLVGYGGANFFEGSGPAPTLSSTLAALRVADGASDTDDNAVDFAAAAPNPRNTVEPPDPGPGTGCDAPATHEIAAVQGPGIATPVAGQVVRVEGVVTGDFQATGQLGGFFVQDDTPDADPATSDGLFVVSTSAASVGDRVRVNGTAVEANGLTQLSPVTAVDVCGTGTVSPAPYDLPRAPGTTFEPVEGVLVTFPEALTATEHFQLGRFGEVTVSSDGRLLQPTERAEPGAPAQALLEEAGRRRIVVDDGSNVQNPPTVPYVAPGDPLRIGDTATGITGVLTFAFGTYRVEPTVPVTFSSDNPRPAAPADVGGEIRVASFNTLNWFTTLGDDNPNARGADNADERDRQLAKEVAALTGLDADVVGLMEVENNGVGPDSAIARLVEALNAAAGPDTYAYVTTEPVLNPPNEFGGEFGTDAIKVALIYKPAVVTPVGAAQTSSDDIFDRPPLIQTFAPVAGGEAFTLAVNHFKSKGCGGATGLDLDQGDGQSCFNARRVAQAETLTGVLDGMDVPNVLVLGDLNAYGEEDPVHTLEAAGYTGLTGQFVPDADRYSFVFDGFSGELDHALAGPELLDDVTGTTIWHVDADEPLIFDYNTEFNPPELYAPDTYRASDHDPLLLGLDLDTPPAAPAVTRVPGWGAATVEWTASGDGGSAITGYQLQARRGDQVVQSVSLGPDARSHTFGQLSNGVAYTFTVVAANDEGAGPAGTASATPFEPRRPARLDSSVRCPSFTVRNPNAFPVSANWITSRGQSGQLALPAGATVTLDARADAFTILFLFAGRNSLQDVAVARC